MKHNILKYLLLAPFMYIYRGIIVFRNFLYDSKILSSKQFNLPIISIGNISVGGTGKTPHTEFILEKLIDSYNVAILSRGYKRKTKGFLLVNEDSIFTDVGDEPLQIKLKFPTAIVAVCENRVKGVEQLLELFPSLQVIILDDAYQHRRINAGLSILLNNYNRPISQDYLLPYGFLREPRSSSHRAHIIIYTKCPNNLTPIDLRILTKDIHLMPFQYLFFSKLKYLDLVPVFKHSNNNKITTEMLKLYNIVIVTGIAYSENLVNYIQSKSKSFVHLKFSDHHNFTSKDINKLATTFNKNKEDSIIITTEKDAIRLKDNKYITEELKEYIYFLPIKVELLNSDEDIKQFDNQIFSYVRNNKRYSKLYKSTYHNEA